MSDHSRFPALQACQCRKIIVLRAAATKTLKLILVPWPAVGLVILGMNVTALMAAFANQVDPCMCRHTVSMPCVPDV